MKKTLSVIFLVLFLLLSVSFAETTLYVQSLKASLFIQPQLGSKQIGELKKGEKVVVVEKKSDWIKVDSSGKVGWIPSIFLSEYPPLEKVSIFEKDTDPSIKESARRRASDFVTAAAVRGLLEDRLRTNQKYLLDLSAVKWLEDLKIEEKEIDMFLESRQWWG